jgi:hypothetical protein
MSVSSRQYAAATGAQKRREPSASVMTEKRSAVASGTPGAAGALDTGAGSDAYSGHSTAGSSTAAGTNKMAHSCVAARGSG